MVLLSALLVSSVLAEPAFAAASGTTQQKSEQQKRRPQTVRRPAPKQDDKSGGFAIHSANSKNKSSGNWLRENQGRRGWSF
jgi:hypothetical protein